MPCSGLLYCTGCKMQLQLRLAGDTTVPVKVSVPSGLLSHIDTLPCSLPEPFTMLCPLTCNALQLLPAPVTVPSRVRLWVLSVVPAPRVVVLPPFRRVQCATRMLPLLANAALLISSLLTWIVQLLVNVAPPLFCRLPVICSVPLFTPVTLQFRLPATLKEL